MPMIRVENLKEGMLVENDIFSTYGSVLVNAGDRLDSRALEKIKLHQIQSVKIIDEAEASGKASILSTINSSVNQEVLEELTETYEEKTNQVKGLFSQVENNETMAINESLTNITSDIVAITSNQKDLFKYINQMKKTSPSIYTHSLNVSILCDLFATLLEYPQQKKHELVLAGMLHDIGKAELGLNIDYNTLNMDNLEPGISETYQKHSTLSYRILKEKNLSKDICMGVLMHHETEQGTGFPTGAKWSQIHEFAKIIAIANYYDHLTYSGETKKELNPFAIIKILEKVQFDKFDINFMSSFLKQLASFYHMEWVELTSGEVAQIIFINNNDLAHPIVKIGNAMVDLSNERNIDILRVL